ncbi:MAG: SMC-Scp complex subunit ScpB [Chlorobiaceae bacterium]|nr:SMC-Scp complex subunit ScpB [Chlorobiaceae bacterium]MBA4308737.1 SMC-Scp complex subunit ScpB [Chlorobiaceae bacterium]
MTENFYNSIIEALIFSSDEPLKASEIIQAIRGIDGDDVDINEKIILQIVADLNQRYDEQKSAFKIMLIADGFIFATRTDFAKYLGYLSNEKSKRRLSAAALETLAIVAYKQPITKPEIETIRGVNSDYILNTLLEKQLITISGRAETIGRPLLYTTTDEFLKYFGLNKLADLPKPREIEEIMQDEDFLEQRRKLFVTEIEESVEQEISREENESN